MTSLQSQSNMSWIEVQFLDTASKALQACRQTLKWTYAFAFYLARNNMTEIFEDNQKDLEMAVENLSQMFEKPVNELGGLKVEILDKTTYCNRRREILLSDTAENLKKGMFSTLFDEYWTILILGIIRPVEIQRRFMIAQNHKGGMDIEERHSLHDI